MVVAIICVMACAVALVACNDETVAVESVTLDKTALTLEEDGEATLTATVTPDNATDKTVTWSSDNTAVATVENGLVKGIAAGSAVITAKVGDKSAACAVTVTAKVNYEVTQAQWETALSTEIKVATMIYTMNDIVYGTVKYNKDEGSIYIDSYYEISAAPVDGEPVVTSGYQYTLFCEEEETIYQYTKQDDDNWQRTVSSEDERDSCIANYAGKINAIFNVIADRYSEFAYSDNAYSAGNISLAGMGTIKKMSIVFENGTLKSAEIVTDGDNGVECYTDISVGIAEIEIPANFDTVESIAGNNYKFYKIESEEADSDTLAAISVGYSNTTYKFLSESSIVIDMGNEILQSGDYVKDGANVDIIIYEVSVGSDNMEVYSSIHGTIQDDILYIETVMQDYNVTLQFKLVK